MVLVPPPFDPELGIALAAVGPSDPSGPSPADIAALRGVPESAVPAYDLTDGGAFTTTDLTVPGPEALPTSRCSSSGPWRRPGTGRAR